MIFCDHQSHLCLSTRRVCGNSSSFLPLFFTTIDLTFTLTRPLLFGSHPVRLQLLSLFYLLSILGLYPITLDILCYQFLLPQEGKWWRCAGEKQGWHWCTFLSINTNVPSYSSQPCSSAVLCPNSDITPCAPWKKMCACLLGSYA